MVFDHEETTIHVLQRIVHTFNRSSLETKKPAVVAGCGAIDYLYYFRLQNDQKQIFCSLPLVGFVV